jgi:hypothetical protein
MDDRIRRASSEKRLRFGCTAATRRQAALASRSSLRQICALPPSMDSSIPVTKLESSEARNSAALATSAGSPSRPIGMVDTILSMVSSGCAAVSGVAIGPGRRGAPGTPQRSHPHDPSTHRTQRAVRPAHMPPRLLSAACTCPSCRLGAPPATVCLPEPPDAGQQVPAADDRVHNPRAH